MGNPNHMKSIRGTVAICTALIVAAAIALTGGCAIHRESAIQGRVIDAETKEPIEGAVAVVVYYKQSIVPTIGGPPSDPHKARETLTDERGEFRLPALFTPLLFAIGDGYGCIFYKPGYSARSYSERGRNRPEEDRSVVEMQRARTWEERRKTRPSSGGLDDMNLPIFFEMLEEEYRYLYNE